MTVPHAQGAAVPRDKEKEREKERERAAAAAIKGQLAAHGLTRCATSGSAPDSGVDGLSVCLPLHVKGV